MKIEIRGLNRQGEWDLEALVTMDNASTVNVLGDALMARRLREYGVNSNIGIVRISDGKEFMDAILSAFSGHFIRANVVEF